MPALPTTPEFWMDWFIAEQATKSNNVDLKMICLNLIKLRDEAYIPKITVNSPLTQGKAIYFYGQRVDEHDEIQVSDNRRKGMRNILPQYGIDCRKDPDNSSILLTYTDWDILLASIGIARKNMRAQRRWKIKQRSNEAGWAVWETRLRRESRGSFVEDRTRLVHRTQIAGPPAETSGNGNVTPSSQEIDQFSKSTSMVSRTNVLGYRRRGIDDGTRRLCYSEGAHWKDVSSSSVSATADMGGSSSTRYRRTDARQAIRSMVRDEGAVEQAIDDDDIGSSDESSSDGSNVKRKLFTNQTLMDLM